MALRVPVLCGLVYSYNDGIQKKARVVAHDGAIYQLIVREPVKPGNVYEFKQFKVTKNALEQKHDSSIELLEETQEFDECLAKIFIREIPPADCKTLQVRVICFEEKQVILSYEDKQLILSGLAFLLFKKFCKGKGPFAIEVFESDLKGTDPQTYNTALWFSTTKIESIVSFGDCISSFQHRSIAGGLRQCSHCEEVWCPSSSDETIASQDDDVLLA